MKHHIDLLVSRYPELNGCREDIMKAYEIMERSYAQDGKLLVAGNGGSAADSEHIVGELMKGLLSLRALSDDKKANR